MNKEISLQGNPGDATVTPTFETADKISQNIKHIARRITEESVRIRETIRVVRESGAINELADAIREAVKAARDTSREVNTAAKDLRERGAIKDSLSALDDTIVSAKDTARVLSDMGEDAKQAAPMTAANISKGADLIKQSATITGQKVKNKLSDRYNKKMANSS
jgi:uncharacterized protein Yka (UPF0111/DUF47 family)